MSKQTTKMSRAVSALEHIYNSLNADFWDGELPTPVITVMSKPGTMGHMTTAKVWQRKDDHAYELNVAAEVLNYNIEDTIDTILHECVHLYCRLHNIKETSRSGSYHNGKFKEIAEAHGLECYMTTSHGWNTRPTDSLIEYAINKGWSEIQMGRNTLPPIMRTGATGAAQPIEGQGGEKRPSSTRKLVCPVCGQTARVTNPNHNIGCWNCMVKMIEA